MDVDCMYFIVNEIKIGNDQFISPVSGYMKHICLLDPKAIVIAWGQFSFITKPKNGKCDHKYHKAGNHRQQIERFQPILNAKYRKTAK